MVLVLAAAMAAVMDTEEVSAKSRKEKKAVQKYGNLD